MRNNTAQLTIDVSGISFARGTSLALSANAWLRSASEKMLAGAEVVSSVRVRSEARANDGAPSGVAALLRSLSGAVTSALRFSARRHVDEPVLPAVVLPSELSSEKQWALVTSAISSFVARAEATSRAQDDARQQVAAARYALDELVRELRGSMTFESSAPPERAPIVKTSSPAVVQIVEHPTHGIAA